MQVFGLHFIFSFDFITVAIKLEKNKQNLLSALEALLPRQTVTKTCLQASLQTVFTTDLSLYEYKALKDINIKNIV